MEKPQRKKRRDRRGSLSRKVERQVRFPLWEPSRFVANAPNSKLVSFSKSLTTHWGHDAYAYLRSMTCMSSDKRRDNLVHNDTFPLADLHVLRRPAQPTSEYARFTASSAPDGYTSRTLLKTPLKYLPILTPILEVFLAVAWPSISTRRFATAHWCAVFFLIARPRHPWARTLSRTAASKDLTGREPV